MTPQRAREQIVKLLAIYEKHPDTAEGRNALKHAERLIAKYKLDHPSSKEPPKAVHNEGVANLFAAMHKLLTTKPKPRSQGVPDIGELERRFTQLLNRSRS